MLHLSGKSRSPMQQWLCLTHLKAWALDRDDRHDDGMSTYLVINPFKLESFERKRNLVPKMARNAFCSDLQLTS